MLEVQGGGNAQDRPIWLDGTLVAAADARVNVLAHGLQRGCLAFDVGALREGPDGRRLLFRAPEHIARFLRSAELVGLSVEHDAGSLLAATLETARASGAASGLVRWSAFVASPEPDVVPRPTARTSTAIAVIATDDSARPAARVVVPRDVRKAGPEVLPPQVKAAGAYLPTMLAKRRALAEGYDEVVLLDREGRIAEAPTANAFAVIGGTLLTPPLERVLAGITRDSVLAVARAEGIATREAHLTPEEFEAADEAFLTATSLPVLAIATIGGHALRAGAPGPVTRRIRRAILACERGQDARFAGWTVSV
jgi:branched-chain amino acid aminotransferase